jgi:hypothetical protein
MEIGVYHEFHCRPEQTAAADKKRKLRDTTATLSSRRSVRRSGTESSQTLCWRKTDSNSQSHLNEKPFRGC